MSARYQSDTNLLLRFLAGQPARQAEAAKRLFEEAAAKLAALLRRRGVKVRDAEQVFDALERLQRTNVGFADAFLAAGGADAGIPVASFDRDLDKFKDVTRFEPS